MISIYKNKESTESNRLRKLLLQTDTQIIGDSLFTELIIQKRKKIRIRIKRRRKFLTNNQKHLRKK